MNSFVFMERRRDKNTENILFPEIIINSFHPEDENLERYQLTQGEFNTYQLLILCQKKKKW